MESAPIRMEKDMKSSGAYVLNMARNKDGVWREDDFRYLSLLSLNRRVYSVASDFGCFIGFAFLIRLRNKQDEN